jgi:hypothetical protein
MQWRTDAPGNPAAALGVVDLRKQSGWERAMALEPMHNEAIRDEIAERLKRSLAREPLEMSPYLDELLHRFGGPDHDTSPSIVPDAAPVAEPPKPATARDWLQRLRDFTRRS